MKSLRNWLLALFAGTIVCGAWLAWRQQAELVELRALVMNRNERANLQKRVWDLEKANRELQNRSGSRPDGAGGEQAAIGPSRASGRGDPRGRGESGMQQMNAVRELLAKPEVQAMIALQQKAGIESRYAALFKNLNLSPEQAANLGALLVERSSTRQDVFNAAREQGIDARSNPEAYRKLLADAQDEVNRGIKSVIGEDGFNQLQTYEQTLPQRSIVNKLQQRLSYTSTPLTSAQSEQLVQILAANTSARPSDSANPAGGQTPPGPPPARSPGFGPPGQGRGPDVGSMVMSLVGGGGPPGVLPDVIDEALRVSGAPVTSAAVAQSQTVLAPPQVAALQQIQQQQQAQQQLQQIFRDGIPGTTRGDGVPNPTRPPANPPIPARPGGS